MKKTLIVLYICGIIPLLSAQNKPIVWSDGKLSWDDFTESTTTNQAGTFRYFLEYKTQKDHFNDTVVNHFVANCRFDKANSTVHPDYKTDQLLRYNQIIFDLTEIYRRDLQHKLDILTLPGESEEIFENITKALNNEIKRFKEDSQDGTNLNKIVLWEQICENRLERHPIERLPAFSVSRFGYGLNAGIGTSILTGSLSNFFTPSFNMAYGFELSWDNSSVFLSATLGGNRQFTSYRRDTRVWPANKGVTYAIGDLAYGYTVFEKGKWKMTPMAGLCISEMSFENQFLRLSDINFLVGLNTEYVIAKRIQLIPSIISEAREYSQTAIRTRLYLTNANFYPDLKGISVNLSVGLTLNGHFLEVFN